jgi:hypothetical protein
MAIAVSSRLFKKETIARGAHHDLESFFWVFAWLILNKLTRPRGGYDRSFGQYFDKLFRGHDAAEMLRLKKTFLFPGGPDEVGRLLQKKRSTKGLGTAFKELSRQVFEQQYEIPYLMGEQTEPPKLTEYDTFLAALDAARGSKRLECMQGTL